MTTKEMGISVAHSRRYGACTGTRSRVHRGRSWRSYGAGGWGLAAAQRGETLGFLFVL
ncbi:hypothetical protein ES332_A12G126000v1 [Gossypium tomentosum]|uniref:Uncharacterized protein n=1 Tax=Gossypium tomentosum TaxID=34277 RepID=A0A5D2MVX6_GOSTO|nr:hypothetical protein ES332_A12G126000v1 [Gossypium tomentosum]